ncbi:MAG: PEP-CTERM sorting domain-containing protein [Aulosira sp. DedQUE10]|nr:PEP-CTERM sorting domain-containing protein [Aulosira sp. DedQUE10]
MVATIAPASHAGTLTIGAKRDTTIFQNNVNNSNGTGVGMFAGNNGSNSTRRALTYFDIAGNLPTGASITDVQLTLFLGQVAGSGGTPGNGDLTPRNISLFRVSNSWGEGTSGPVPPSPTIGGTGQGFAANPGDATWNARFYDPVNPVLWGTPGGDFAANPSATITVGRIFNESYTWGSTAAMVADVQEWLDNPSENFGWLLQNESENAIQSFRAFWTSNATNPTFRPQLQITYAEPVPEPSTSLGALAAISIGAALKQKFNKRRYS